MSDNASGGADAGSKSGANRGSGTGVHGDNECASPQLAAAEKRAAAAEKRAAETTELATALAAELEHVSKSEQTLRRAAH
eukprot:5017224-Pleurochrysis_carterae.AAC.1